MNLNLRTELKKCLESYINSSIMLCSQKGTLVHSYILRLEDLTRERWSQSLEDDVIAFFHNNRVDAEYISEDKEFKIILDLNECLLNPNQAESVATAISYFTSQ